MLEEKYEQNEHTHTIHTQWFSDTQEPENPVVAWFLRLGTLDVGIVPYSVSHWRSWEHNNCLVYTAGDLENLEGSWRVIGPFDSCTEIRTNFFSAGIRSSNRINSLVAKWKTLNELALFMFLQFMLPILKIMQKLNIKCKELSKNDIDDFQ